MNEQLLRDVRDAIAADIDHFDMGTWIDSPAGMEFPLAACGTTACLAGHAVIQHATRNDLPWRFRGCYEVVTGDTVEEIATFATRLLGLPDGGGDGCSLLFLMIWPDHYLRCGDREDDAKAVIELIDDILDGITVWDGHEWVYLPDDVVADDGVPA